MDAVTAVYLLGSILNRFNSTDNRDQFNEVRECMLSKNTKQLPFMQTYLIHTGIYQSWKCHYTARRHRERKGKILENLLLPLSYNN